jgi:putative peptidoglycan lipid II flippase
VFVQGRRQKTIVRPTLEGPLVPAATHPQSPGHESTGRHAFLVASGILLRSLTGLVRQRVFARYFGQQNPIADAFNAAFRIPNFLQNLFGEGVLSASFIPVYARLLAEGDEEESGRVAGAVFALLALTASVLTAVGMAAAPYLIDVIAMGFHGAERQLTIQLVRILFPGTAMLVLSAWCLGILNSHRRFFLSYTAPVVWNAAMIACLVGFHGGGQLRLATLLAWASVAGSALQFAVQLPLVLKLAPRLRVHLDTRSGHVREIVANFGPVFLSRGVVQISAYVDSALASLLGYGAVTGLTNAQALNMLPVSLFGMAISAAELPAMSSALGNTEEVAAYLRRRLDSGLRRIAFFVVPCALGFLALGDVMAGLLFQNGAFHRPDSVYVWGILAGSSVGLLATTLGRLYSSTYWALRDTRTPLRFALIRVALTTGLGWLSSVPLPIWLGIAPRWGVAGLTASAGVAGWVEFTLLRRTLNRRIGHTGLPAVLTAKLWLAAVVAGALAWAVKLAIGVAHPVSGGALILATYGAGYLALTYALRVEESADAVARVRRLARTGSR